MRVGDWVRCEREAPAKGTWTGVRFTASNNEAPTWFRANELIKATRPRNAPDIRTARERTQVTADRQNASEDLESRCTEPSPGQDAPS